MAKQTKTHKRRRNHKRSTRRSTRRSAQRGGSGYQSHATFHQDTAVAGGLSSARFYPLSDTTSPSEWGGVSTRIIGGRRRRNRQTGGGGFATGGMADYQSAYSNGASTTTANTAVEFVSGFPLTNTNTANNSPMSYKMNAVI